MFRKLIGGLTSTAVIGALATAGAVGAGVATATPALAATVNVGTVEAQMAGHTGKSGTVSNAENCVRFSPPDNSSTPPVQTLWVTNPIEALASHGSGSRSGCPTNLDKEQGGQSAIGISPRTSNVNVDTGSEFLLGTMKHYNNPITVTENPAKFVGNLSIKLGGVKFAFPYELYETPNGCSTKVDPQQNVCSDDILEFTGTPTGELTIGGYDFSLVSGGFTAADSEGKCTPTPTPPSKTKFITTEQTTTTGCLYGKLAQKRSIKLVKKVEWNPDVNGPTSIPNFAFTSTSDLVGSPWQTNPGNLQPANTNGATASYGPKTLRAGAETVTITEGAVATDWTFKNVQCVDGAGAAVAGVTSNNRTVTLANVPDATSQAAVPITCTFTNTYTPVLQPGIKVVKTADKAEVHVGDTVDYTYTVTNTGNTALKDVSVTDDKCVAPGPAYNSGDSNSDGKLQTTETWIYKCSMALNQTTTNIATASGKDPNNKTVTATDTKTVKVLDPKIKVVKTANKAEVKPGGEVTYSYAVTTDGSATPLKDVTLVDDKCASIIGPTKTGGDQDALLEQGETWTYSCTGTLQATTTNIATATGKDNLNKTVSDTDTLTVTVFKPGIKVVKTPDKAEVKAGGSVTYTYEVSNSGDTPLLKVKVTDDKCAPVEYKSGDTDENEILGLKETWTFTCTTILNETTENTAVASGEDRTGQPVEDTAKAKVIVPKPGIKVVKTASATSVNVGGNVTYTYTVTNTGDIELLNVTVTDDKCSPVNYKSGDANTDKKLQVDETWIFECSMALTEATTNTAVASGEDRTGQPVSANDTMTVPVVSPVVVKKICPIDVTLHKPQPTKVGNRIMTDKIKTKKSSCVLLKPVVLCRPIASSAAGETAFCDTKVTKKGRITVKTKGYEAVRVSVVVRTKPKPGFFDRWKPDTWRKSWKLK